MWTGGLNAPVYTFLGFEPVATAEARPEELSRPLPAGHRPLAAALRQSRGPPPEPPEEQNSSCRLCGLALAVMLLLSGCFAVAVSYLRPQTRWQRLLPHLALPQVKSENNKALRFRSTTLSSAPPFQAIAVGKCDDYGLDQIADLFTCRTAAGGLELLEAGFPITFDKPEGCHYWGPNPSVPSGHSTHRICAARSADAKVLAVPAPVPAPVATVAPVATMAPAAPIVTTTTAQCGMMEKGYEYPGNDLYLVNASSAEACCQVCGSDPRCLAWTWAGQHRELQAQRLCFLKGRRPRAALTRVRNDACVSGSTAQAAGSLQVKAADPGQSLFCFSLVLPFGYEGTLIAMQYKQGASIFACDEYATYSNKTLEVAPAVETGIVASDLVVKKGGEFGTVLNTDVFLAVWDKVVADGRYFFHDWTVKVDPDAVFLPVRLRKLLLKHEEAAQGTYLNNCKFGMHGPIEVFSRNAVKALGAGSDTCMKHFTKLCSGKCKWGEDMFIDQCLMKVLKAKRENDYGLLLEDHCDPPARWSSCQDPTVAAFHPFKAVDDYRYCLANATAQ